MSLDQRLTQAARQIADNVESPEVNVEMLRSQVRTIRHRKVSLTAAAAAAAIAVTAIVLTDQDPGVPQPAGQGTVSSTIATRPSPPTGIDAGAWTPYTSTRYDIHFAHPPDWTVLPATRDWTWEKDLAGPPPMGMDDSGFESFRSPDNNVLVSVWSVPLDEGTRIDSTDQILDWVQEYCDRGASYCNGIRERAVKLCIEAADCHPGLLVPFHTDVQAFFPGPWYDRDAMTVVAVWRGPNYPLAPPYGNSRRLLEAFLWTMDVHPVTASGS